MSTPGRQTKTLFVFMAEYAWRALISAWRGRDFRNKAIAGCCKPDSDDTNLQIVVGHWTRLEGTRVLMSLMRQERTISDAVFGNVGRGVLLQSEVSLCLKCE